MHLNNYEIQKNGTKWNVFVGRGLPCLHNLSTHTTYPGRKWSLFQTYEMCNLKYGTTTSHPRDEFRFSGDALSLRELAAEFCLEDVHPAPASVHSEKLDSECVCYIVRGIYMYVCYCAWYMYVCVYICVYIYIYICVFMYIHICRCAYCLCLCALWWEIR